MSDFLDDHPGACEVIRLCLQSHCLLGYVYDRVLSGLLQEDPTIFFDMRYAQQALQLPVCC